MKHALLSAAFALTLVTPSCATDEGDDLPDLDELAEREQLQAPPPAPSRIDPTDARRHHEAHEAARPPEVMPGAREAFDEITKLIDDKYVDGPLTEDELYTAAIDGVMARLVRHHGKQVNLLMRPSELAELEVGTSGQLVGIGVMIEMVADVVVVNGVLPDSPAEKAGLVTGDRILGVDGERLGKTDLRHVVDLIRGEKDTTVDLFVQRDTEEWTVSIERGAIRVRAVESAMLSDTVGYVRLTNFARGTAEELDAALRGLSESGMERLVLDLRGCPGGLLEVSIQVADRFLPPGKAVVTVASRDGEDEVLSTETDDPWEAVPMVVLADHKTASSAEILTAALSHYRRARVVGEPTFGKDTVETVRALDDGWGLKLSVGRFRAPGADGEEPGVRPDLHIPGPEKSVRVPVAELDPETDAQLDAALEILE